MFDSLITDQEQLGIHEIALVLFPILPFQVLLQYK